MVNAKNNKNDKDKVSFNFLRWLVVLVLIIAGVAANTYFAEVAWGIRTSVGLVVVIVALGIAATTKQGRVAMAFMKSAKVELRKVVWPTRQETLQMTLIVVVLVGVASVILWGLDALFHGLVYWLTMKGGS